MDTCPEVFQPLFTLPSRTNITCLQRHHVAHPNEVATVSGLQVVVVHAAVCRTW